MSHTAGDGDMTHATQRRGRGHSVSNFARREIPRPETLLFTCSRRARGSRNPERPGAAQLLLHTFPRQQAHGACHVGELGAVGEQAGAPIEALARERESVLLRRVEDEIANGCDRVVVGAVGAGELQYDGLGELDDQRVVLHEVLRPPAGSLHVDEVVRTKLIWSGLESTARAAAATRAATSASPYQCTALAGP